MTSMAQSHFVGMLSIHVASTSRLMILCQIKKNVDLVSPHQSFALNDSSCSNRAVSVDIEGYVFQCVRPFARRVPSFETESTGANRVEQLEH
jgi:hypothetical protein